MARVREVVDMALDNGLYVILNNHHENFIIPDYEHEESLKETLVKLWKQIAEEFKEYDERLFFEGMNEPRMKDTSEEWTDGSEESREVVNNLNEALQELKTAIQENFLANKIPVVITEFGCDKKPSDDERIKWLKYYVGSFAEKGVPCIWWDNGKEEMYRIIDRENAVITKNELVDTFISFYDR